MSTLANGGDLLHFNLNFFTNCFVHHPRHGEVDLADDDFAPLEYKATGADLSLNKLVAARNKKPDVLSHVFKAPQALEIIDFFDPERCLGGTGTERINGKYIRLNFQQEFISANVSCLQPAYKQYSSDVNHVLSTIFSCRKDIDEFASVQDNSARY